MNDKQHLYTEYETYNRRSKGGEKQALEPHTPVLPKPLEVRVIDNFDKAFKIFRSMVQKERVISLYKEKQSYEKPSVKRRRKQAEGRQKRFEAEFKKDRMEKSDKPQVRVLQERKKEVDVFEANTNEL
jgi:small subunit ribosomal protein S21